MNIELNLSADLLNHIKAITEDPGDDALALCRVDQFEFDDCAIRVGDSIRDGEKSGVVVALVKFPLYGSGDVLPFAKIAILGEGEDWQHGVLLGDTRTDGYPRQGWSKVETLAV